MNIFKKCPSIITILCFSHIAFCQSYRQELKKWDHQRIEELTNPEGWTTLIGLYWLDPGENPFGSGDKVNIQFPDDFPDNMGTFVVTSDSVKLSVEVMNPPVKINGEEVLSAYLSSDLSGDKTIVEWKSYNWHIIQRGQKLGIRLRDTLADARFTLKKISRYTQKKHWIKSANLLPAKSRETILIANVLGQRLPTPIAGRLVFEYRGVKYQLVALRGGQDQYLIIFGDQTNSDETYGGGRFLDISIPKDGKIIIDFNKSYNPPCVYSDYATCPLPPAENVLPFKVNAGEKDSGH